jgi:hypothetical protein
MVVWPGHGEAVAKRHGGGDGSILLRPSAYAERGLMSRGIERRTIFLDTLWKVLLRVPGVSRLTSLEARVEGDQERAPEGNDE